MGKSYFYSYSIHFYSFFSYFEESRDYNASDLLLPFFQFFHPLDFGGPFVLWLLPLYEVYPLELEELGSLAVEGPLLQPPPCLLNLLFNYLILCGLCYFLCFSLVFDVIFYSEKSIMVDVQRTRRRSEKYFK